MRYGYAFQQQLRSEIESIPKDVRDRVERPGALQVDDLIKMTGQPRADDDDTFLMSKHKPSRNWTRYRPENDFSDAFAAVNSGHVAFVITNGDAGTWRVPGIGISLIAHKIASSAFKVNCQMYRPPTWIMCSPPSTRELASIISGISPPMQGCIFEGFETYVMNVMGYIAKDAEGHAMTISDGDGSLLASLLDAGVLDDNPDVKYLYVSDCRDASTSFDVHALQQHIEDDVKLSSFVHIEPVLDVDNDDRYVASADDNACIVDGYSVSAEVKHMAFNRDLHRSLGTHIINVETLKAHQLQWQRKRSTRGANVLQWYERSLASLTRLVPNTDQLLITDDGEDAAQLMHFKSEREMAGYEKRFKLKF